MSNASFVLDLQNFIAKAQGNVDLVVRKASFDVFRSVVIKSPVDTGRFKSNWQVNIGSIPAGTLNTVDPSGGAALARITSETLQMRAGQVIYLANNLSYARRLEYGYSKQAPAGMVRLSILEFNTAVAKAAKQVNP